MTPMLCYLSWSCQHDPLYGNKHWWAAQTVLLPVTVMVAMAQVAWENLFSY